MRRERRAWGYGGIFNKRGRATATASATVEQGGRLRLQRGWCIAVRQRVQARGRRRGAAVEERPDSQTGALRIAPAGLVSERLWVVPMQGHGPNVREIKGTTGIG